MKLFTTLLLALTVCQASPLASFFNFTTALSTGLASIGAAPSSLVLRRYGPLTVGSALVYPTVDASNVSSGSIAPTTDNSDARVEARSPAEVTEHKKVTETITLGAAATASASIAGRMKVYSQATTRKESAIMTTASSADIDARLVTVYLVGDPESTAVEEAKRVAPISSADLDERLVTVCLVGDPESTSIEEAKRAAPTGSAAIDERLVTVYLVGDPESTSIEEAKRAVPTGSVDIDERLVTVYLVGNPSSTPTEEAQRRAAPTSTIGDADADIEAREW